MLNEKPFPVVDPKLGNAVAGGLTSGFGSAGLAPKGFEEGAPNEKGAVVLLVGVLG